MEEELKNEYEVGCFYNYNFIEKFCDKYNDSLIIKEVGSNNGAIGKQAIHLSAFTTDVWFIYNAWTPNGAIYKCVYNE